jgi:hypothetical protein
MEFKTISIQAKLSFVLGLEEGKPMQNAILGETFLVSKGMYIDHLAQIRCISNTMTSIFVNTTANVTTPNVGLIHAGMQCMFTVANADIVNKFSTHEVTMSVSYGYTPKSPIVVAPDLLTSVDIVPSEPVSPNLQHTDNMRELAEINLQQRTALKAMKASHALLMSQLRSAHDMLTWYKTPVRKSPVQKMKFVPDVIDLTLETSKKKRKD